MVLSRSSNDHMNPNLKFSGEPRVAIVAFNHRGGNILRTRDGISRAIATICAYFRDRAFVATDAYRKGSTHHICADTRIYEFGRNSGIVVPYLSGSHDILRYSLLLEKLAQNSFVNVMFTMGFKSLLSACIVNFLLRGRIMVSWLIYDEEEVTLLSRFSAKLFVSLGLLDQILVLSTMMKQLVEERMRVRNVSVLRLGISPELLELSKRSSQDLIGVPTRFEQVTRVRNTNGRSSCISTELLYHAVGSRISYGRLRF